MRDHQRDQSQGQEAQGAGQAVSPQGVSPLQHGLRQSSYSEGAAMLAPGQQGGYAGSAAARTPAPAQCQGGGGGAVQRSTTMSTSIQAKVQAAEGEQSEASAPLVLGELEGEEMAFVDDQDAVSSTLSYTGDVSRGGGAPSGFGVTRSRLGRWKNVVVGPASGGAFPVTADLTYTILWQVRGGTGPGGQVDIPNASAAVLHQGNYADAARDLTPNMGDLGGRPPRAAFWAEDLTERHELFHADERSRFGGEGVTRAQTWLNGQTAATQTEVTTLLTRARTDTLSAHIASKMTYPGKEERAYGDGAALYQARAAEITRKGDANGYGPAPGGSP